MGLEAGTTMVTQQVQQQHQAQQAQQQQQQQQQTQTQQTGVGNGMYNPPFGVRAPSFPNLQRQASIYSLTLDEFQNAISEPGQKQNFGSMNMDEFLRSVWTAEESQAMAAALAAGADQQQMGLVRQTSIQKQNSLTLPRTLSRKTVEEVWRDMIGNQDQVGQQRQMTFGEMTLEDFLVKAGVVREEMGTAPGVEAGNAFAPAYSQPPSLPPPPAAAPDSGGAQAATNATLAAIQNAANQQQAEWINYQLNHASAAAAALAQQQHHQQQQMLQQHAAEAAAAFVNAHKRATVATLPSPQPAAPLAVMPPHAMIERPAVPVAEAVPQLSPPNHANGVTTAAIVSTGDTTPRGKKRGPGEVVEKVVERRQRRMIKNRESAARSRARKQAYTVELEAEIVQLKDENSALRRQQEDEVEKRRQMILAALVPIAQQNQHGSEKPVLRRCRTGPW